MTVAQTPLTAPLSADVLPKPGRVVSVTAPSRLHFGLFSFGDSGHREFGGVGAMIQQPGIRLHLSAGDHFEATGPLADRVSEFARRWAANRASSQSGAAELGASEPPPVHIDVEFAAAQHTGLGVGTQLGMSVAAGLNALVGAPQLSPAQLAISVGRAGRSSVGTYGFVHGGLLVEAGKLPSEPVAPLAARVSIPDSWRFVLLTPTGELGLSGESEQQAFDNLPPVRREVTETLWTEVHEHMLPAARQERFEVFADSVYRYGRTAGMCFAARQGGPYNGPRLASLVETVRSLGYRGVGQSSWGPTVFVLAPTHESAEELVAALQCLPAAEDVRAEIALPDNNGANISVFEAV